MGIVWTFRARGLVPSLGAGGSLVVATLCCLILATAVLTFRDWPGAGEGATGGTLMMPAPSAKASGRAASGPSAPAAASAAASTVAAPTADRPSGTRPARRTAARRAPVPAGTNPPAGSAPAPVAAPAPASAAPRPAASAPAAPVSAPQPARGPGPVEQVVENVRKSTDPLPLPPVVQQPVQPVLDAVQDVGRTVDGVTGPLLP